MFLITRLTPGSPAAIILGQGASPEQIAALSKEMGLDEPVVNQYFIWLSNIFHGDFGYSYFLNKPVLGAIWDNVGPTVSLAILAQILAWCLLYYLVYMQLNIKERFVMKALWEPAF